MAEVISGRDLSAALKAEMKVQVKELFQSMEEPHILQLS